MRQRRGPIEYFDDRSLWRGFNAAFEIALSHDLKTDRFAPNNPIPVVCIDSPGTKRPEGGIHIPDPQEGSLTLSFVDPLTRTLDRREISRTFLERGPIREIKTRWRSALRPHRSKLSLQAEHPRDCLFIPFQIDHRLRSQTPYRETAVSQFATYFDSLSEIDENDPRIISKMRCFHQAWSNKTCKRRTPDLGREVQSLTQAFNRSAAHFLMMLGKPVLVQSTRDENTGKYRLARNLVDLDGHVGRFTGPTRNPVAFLNATQLSLAIQGVSQNVFDEFSGPKTIYPKPQNSTEKEVLHPKLTAIKAVLSQAPTQDLLDRLNSDPSQFFDLIAELIMTSPDTENWNAIKIDVLKLIDHEDSKKLYLACVPHDTTLKDIRFHTTKKNRTHALPMNVVIKNTDDFTLYRKDVRMKFFPRNRQQQNEIRAINIAFIQYLIARVSRSEAIKTMAPLALANVLSHLRCVQKWRYKTSE